jgi:hypothetical protein
MSFKSVFIAALVLGSNVVAAPGEVCEALSPQEVAKTIGAGDMSLSYSNAKVYTGDQYRLSKGMGGVNVAVCIYTTGGSTTTAIVRVLSFESAAAAQEHMKNLADAKSREATLKPGDTIEPDKVGGAPAIFENVRSSGSMATAKGAKVISAGVSHRPPHASERDISRSLLAAELARF